MHVVKRVVGERHCLRCRHRITVPAIRALAMTVPGEASAACQVRHVRAERAQHERHEGGLRREDVDRERGADEHAELEEGRAARSRQRDGKLQQRHESRRGRTSTTRCRASPWTARRTCCSPVPEGGGVRRVATVA